MRTVGRSTFTLGEDKGTKRKAGGECGRGRQREDEGGRETQMLKVRERAGERCGCQRQTLFWGGGGKRKRDKERVGNKWVSGG